MMLLDDDFAFWGCVMIDGNKNVNDSDNDKKMVVLVMFQINI